MKELYESILSSTGAGVGAEIEQIKNWIKSLKLDNSQNWKIEVENERDGFVVSILDITERSKSNISFGRLDMNDNPLYKGWHIKKYINSRDKSAMNVTYQNCVVYDKDLPDEVKDTVTFSGCSVSVKKLPKNCKTLRFPYMNSLSGGHGTNLITPIVGAKLENVFVGQHWKGQSGLSGNISSMFRRCTITNHLDVNDSMLGYFSLERGKNRLTKSASNSMDELLNKNTISDNIIVYTYPIERQKTARTGMLNYNKKNCVWKVKPIKE